TMLISSSGPMAIGKPHPRPRKSAGPLGPMAGPWESVTDQHHGRAADQHGAAAGHVTGAGRGGGGDPDGRASPGARRWRMGLGDGTQMRVARDGGGHAPDQHLPLARGHDDASVGRPVAEPGRRGHQLIFTTAPITDTAPSPFRLRAPSAWISMLGASRL